MKHRANVLTVVALVLCTVAAAGLGGYWMWWWRGDLQRAVVRGDIRRVKARLGKYPDTAKKEGGDLLLTAAYVGQTEIVKLLLESGADPNAKEPWDHTWGETALHLAVLGPLDSPGHKDVVELLIAYGADVNGTDRTNRTPLHVAVQTCEIELTKLLLANGADPCAKMRDGTTALHSAAQRGGPAEELADMLLASGADINARDSKDQTPLHRAVGHTRAHPGNIEFLLAHGANVNARDAEGKTPLHEATYSEAPLRIVQVLLEAGADVTAMDAKGRTPLDIAVQRGHKEVVELLRRYSTLE